MKITQKHTKICLGVLVANLCPTLCNPMQLAKLLCPWHSPGENTGVGCHSLFQGIFLTQGLNPCLLCLLYWQEDSLPAEPSGKQYIQCNSNAKIIQNTLLRFAVDRIPSLVHSLLIWLEATDSLEYWLVTMQSGTP